MSNGFYFIGAGNKFDLGDELLVYQFRKLGCKA